MVAHEGRVPLVTPDHHGPTGGAPDSGHGALERFQRLAARLLEEPLVEQGSGFGAVPGLRVGRKIFAMLCRGELVVKLPRTRVDQLVVAGAAARFDARRDGRLMKEWATIPVEHGDEWDRLADEALEFVRSNA